MLASGQAVWYALMASSMAFFWAEEPSALRSPLKQSPAAVEPPAAVDPAPGWAPLFSDAQAESARAPDRAMAPRALIRETDTSVFPLDGTVLVAGRALPTDGGRFIHREGRSAGCPFPHVRLTPGERGATSWGRRSPRDAGRRASADDGGFGGCPW